LKNENKKKFSNEEDNFIPLNFYKKPNNENEPIPIIQEKEINSEKIG